MILKKVHFPFFYLLLAIGGLLSCESNVENHPLYEDSFNKAELYFENAKFDSSFYYYQKVKVLCQSQKDFDNIMYPMLMMSEIQRIKNDFSGCEETITEAITYLKKDTKKSYSTFIYNNLGLAYLEQSNYKEATKYYNVSLAITTDEIARCIIKNNIAYSYIKQKNYKKAKEVLESIKNKAVLKSNPIEYARIIDNLGYALFHLQEQQSLFLLKESKKIREKENDIVGLTASYMHLAEYHQKADSNTAKKYALKAKETAIKTRNPDDKMEALEFLTELSEGNEAKEYAIVAFALNDSISKVRQQAKNQFAKLKYDSKQTLKELDKQKQLKEFSVIGIVLLFLIGIVTFSKIKRRNLKKIKETAYQTETRIAKKLHDELSNDVHNTIAFAETQDLENPVNKDALLENLETIYNRARNISSENKDIDTGEHYLEKLKAMLATYNSAERNIIVNVDTFNHLKTTKEVKIVIHRVLQELIVNMKKHSQCSLVSISIKSSKKSLQINYSDNGIGSNNMLNLKNGLQNAENRILSINGSINFDTALEKGFKVKIEIPK